MKFYSHLFLLLSFSMLDKAEALAQRIEIANKRTEELLMRQEQLLARQSLSGRGEAGIMPIVKPPISDIEYSKRFFNGDMSLLREDAK